jgi:hypothetical protein
VLVKQYRIRHADAVDAKDGLRGHSHPFDDRPTLSGHEEIDGYANVHAPSGSTALIPFAASAMIKTRCKPVSAVP